MIIVCMSIIDIVFSLDRSFELGNYKDFFCTAAAQALYLQFCIMMPYINEVIAVIEIVLFSYHSITCLFGLSFCV